LRKVIPSMVPPGIRALANVMDPAAPIVDKTETLNSRLAAQVIHTAEAFSDSENIERYVSAQMNNEVEQTILLAQGGGMFPEEGVQLKQHLLDIERNLIRHALASAEGNVSKTARLLNLQRTTLIEKISKHGLSSDV
jgi:sigma-54 specific flagellar transcriptional regulator A